MGVGQKFKEWYGKAKKKCDDFADGTFRQYNPDSFRTYEKHRADIDGELRELAGEIYNAAYFCRPENFNDIFTKVKNTFEVAIPVVYNQYDGAVDFTQDMVSEGIEASYERTARLYV